MGCFVFNNKERRKVVPRQWKQTEAIDQLKGIVADEANNTNGSELNTDVCGPRCEDPNFLELLSFS